MRTRKKLEDIHKYCAAYLAGEEHRAQNEIAETLGISQAAVSRLLKDAREQGLLTIKFSREKIPPEIMDEVISTCSGEEYNSALRDFTKHLDRSPLMRVFSSGDPGADTTKRTATFGDNAAPYIRELLLSCRRLGVTWGGVLRFVLNSLNRAGVASPWKSGQVDVVPLAGDPQSVDPADTGSSIIANELSQRINGTLPKTHYSLGMVPAIIPEDFGAADLAVVRKLIGKVRSYEEIWGRDGRGEKVKRGIVDELDGIFTSVGPARRPLGWGRDSQLLESGGIIRELPKLAYGDIGGVVIPRDGLSKDQTAVLEGVISRWTGLTIEDLKACFQRARKEDQRTPGVVAICFGEDRADFIYDLLRSRAAQPGVINHLVVDHTFAKRLLRRIAGHQGTSSQKGLRSAARAGGFASPGSV